MPVTRIPIDGLWRCLCPAINTLTVAQSARPLRSAKKLPIHPNVLSSSIRRLHSSSPTQSEDTQNAVRDHKFSPRPDEPAFNSPPSRPLIRPVDARAGSSLRSLTAERKSRPGILGEKGFARYATLDDVPITHLHQRLRQTGSEDNEYDHVVELVDYLIIERGDPPALVHYDALIRVNVDAENGSAAIVEGLLGEMKQEGIGADSGLYHAVLQVLAIHPDYLLRNQVMQEMKERWLGLSPDGWHSLVVGLLRDRQFEAAMEKLEQMQSDEVYVQPWLYDIFLYQLCEIGELDAVFKMLRYRFEHKRTEISHTMWYYLLDNFSSNFHVILCQYAGTKFIWRARIQTSQVVPSDGICISTLNLAAREADPGLATSAIRILSARRSALSTFHYEALLSAYAGAGDLKSSFRILTIMTKAGLEPDSSTTRPLFLYLTQNDSFPSKAWKTLKAINHDGHAIPAASVNVVIEAKIHREQFIQAVEFYKELHTICKSGPNTETFNILLQGVTRHSNKSSAMFFASEMRALGVKADRLTYDRFILACLKDADYEDAFRYLEEMRIIGANKEEDGQKGWWMRGGTARSLIQRCAKGGDLRIWDLLDEMERRALDQGRTRKWVEGNWEGERKGNQLSEKLAQWNAT
ncbi:Pentatricopeptide repeat-containing [Hyphodiscus hymeniophilus]|uniref:Pentatricopeptide repeat-containing n=1 Tax=Hyphodiscus hymeniophilus TaxID=353542 RepID=A0A9P7AWY6_9HELO|nr:Pentatricopeptide repeat-containing [Hyphodiscus hymeniophilus]